MSKNREDARRFFPKLDLEVLKVHVARWVCTKNSGYQNEIERVWLYRYDLSQYDIETITFDPRLPPWPELKRYAIVFEVANPKRFEFFIPPDEPTRQRQLIKTEDPNVYTPVGVKVDLSKVFFDEVYKSRTTDDLKELREEWEVFDKGVDEEEIEFEKRTHWALCGEPAFKLFDAKEAAPTLEDLEKNKDQSETGTAKFQVPEGTGWDQITITAIDLQHVKIKTPWVEKLVHYAELGWADRRSSGTPKRQYGLFLDFIVNQTVGPGSEKNYNALSKLVHDLSIDLKNLFGIKENPFTRYSKKKGYLPKLRLFNRMDVKALKARSEQDPKSFFDEIVSERSSGVKDKAASKRPSWVK